MTRTKMLGVASSVLLASFVGMNSAGAVTILVDELQNAVVQGLPANTVLGAVLLCENGAAACDQQHTGSISDILVFGLAGGGQTAQASLISDALEGGEIILPDTASIDAYPLPANVFAVPEVILPPPNELLEGALWTPGPGQPGFIVGQNTTYQILSDPVPVPAAVWLFGSALGLLGIRRRQS